MSPDSKLRMDVYQEGQRAFNAGTPCPYTDWRAGTWEKGRAAAQAYLERPIEPTRADAVSKAEALEALDSLDDYARMSVGVDAFGPRELLRRFIEEQ